MARVVRRTVVDPEQLDALLAPRTTPVLERVGAEHCYEAVEGPVLSYQRRVEVASRGPGSAEVIETFTFRLAIPYFAWLFVLPVKGALRRPPWKGPAWWLPPDRYDARAASVLATLCLIAVVFGYLNTLFSQTIAFAAEEFRADNQAQGLAGGTVRAGGVLALVLVAAADRRGRRRVILVSAAAGCLLAAVGALAPSLGWLTSSQLLARAFASALALVVTISLAEESPARSRAYALSLLAMASALGAGFCVMALRLADLGERGWRLIYVLPLVGLAVVPGIARRLPESRRFEAPHADAPMRGHGRRLWLLAVSGFVLNLFVAPNSQFFNRFLRQERGYSGGAISLIILGTATPGAIGVVLGGRLADLRGRREVAAVALVVGTGLNVLVYFAAGPAMWMWATLANIISAATIPALGVYGPELFPTALRGRSNGLIAMLALVGSGIGLTAAGAMADRFGRFGPAMAILGVAPLLVAVLVLVAYPETAGMELEEINPEDADPD